MIFHAKSLHLASITDESPVRGVGCMHGLL